MKKINSIVIYGTRSGNTKKVADEIAKELKCLSVLIKDISKYNLDDYNLFIVGSPVHAFKPLKEISQFLVTLKKGKRCAFFVTYGAPFWGNKSAENCMNFMEKKTNCNSIGRFKCYGFHHILRTYQKHPDEVDLKNAMIFAKKISEKQN